MPPFGARQLGWTGLLSLRILPTRRNVDGVLSWQVKPLSDLHRISAVARAGDDLIITGWTVDKEQSMVWRCHCAVGSIRRAHKPARRNLVPGFSAPRGR